LEELLYALGIKETRGISTARMQRLAVARLAGTRGLLVVDEAQHLSLNALETLRAIHDAAAIGLALVGNEHVYSRLTGNGKSALFAQLFSRIGRREALRKPPVSDVEALASGWEIAGKEGFEFLRRIAATPGALRQMVKTLRLAAQFARAAGEALSAQHLKAAWGELSGEARQPEAM
jgi:DNA transposition AAA+ family ATPase